MGAATKAACSRQRSAIGKGALIFVLETDS